MHIKVDDLSGKEIRQLLWLHLSNLSSISPPESMHALDLDALRKPSITFWSVWSDFQSGESSQLMGCGALMELDSEHAEVKSMRTAPEHLRKGVASELLTHLVAEARRRGYRRLSLETGAGDAFFPAHHLYTKFGFKPCPPFAGYTDDPNSRFFSLRLEPDRFAVAADEGRF
jgi:putative acetyltransferase